MICVKRGVKKQVGHNPSWSILWWSEGKFLFFLFFQFFGQIRCNRIYCWFDLGGIFRTNWISHDLFASVGGWALILDKEKNLFTLINWWFTNRLDGVKIQLDLNEMDVRDSPQACVIYKHSIYHVINKKKVENEVNFRAISSPPESSR